MTYDTHEVGAVLTSELPARIEHGGGTALVLEGSCNAAADRLVLELAGHATPVTLAGLEHPERGRQAWKAVLGIPGSVEAGGWELSLAAQVEGERASSPLGHIELVNRDRRRSPAPASWVGVEGGPIVAVCLATWEPDPGRLRRQIDSIRAQTGVDWICVISDDHSSRPRTRAIEEIVAGDPRFIFSRAAARAGFAANFERALRMAPAEADYIALCDQDDVWRPDKLVRTIARLRREPGSMLAFTDFRLTNGSGEVLADTYWTARRPRPGDLASLLVANQVTGAASVFRRELLADALPFPPDPGGLYHDHWLALTALAAGGIAYLGEPTYDHVRYEDAVTVSAQERAADELPARSRALSRQRLARLPRVLAGLGPEGREGLERYLLVAALATTIRLRFGERLSPRHRRVLERVIGGGRSGPSAAWLALRGLRPMLGRDETMGREHFLLSGLLWARRGGRAAAGGSGSGAQSR